MDGIRITRAVAQPPSCSDPRCSVAEWLVPTLRQVGHLSHDLDRARPYRLVSCVGKNQPQSVLAAA